MSYPDLTDGLEFNKLFKQSNVGFVILNQSREIISCNSAFLNLIGYDFDEIKNITFSELIHPCDQKENSVSIEKVYKEFTQFSLEERICSKNGESIWCLLDLTLIENKTSKNIVIIVQNISKRKNIEASLLKTNRALRTLNSCIQSIVKEKDPEKLLQQICRNIVEEGGYKLAWIGKAVHDEKKTVLPVAYAGYEEGYLEKIHVSWDDSKSGNGPVGLTIKTKKIATIHDVLFDPSFEPWREHAKERGYQSVIGLPLYFANHLFGALAIYAPEPDAFQENEIVHLVNLCKQLEYGLNHLETEKEKELIQKQLFQSQKMEAIGTLAGGIAHDFNNFLQIIYGNSEIIKMELLKNDKNYEPINDILSAAHSAANLTRQLLLFSRNEHVALHEVDLNQIMDGILVLLRRVIEENIKIDFQKQPGLWYIMGNDGLIEQIVLNLCINARDAMEEGGRIIIETGNLMKNELDEKYILDEDSDKYVMLTVKDTGQGMSKETLNHIFEPFFSTKAPGKGTGLGLAVVYGIIKKLKGNIYVESEPGKGSSFKIILPALNQIIALQDDNKESLDIQGQNQTILFVEDEEYLAKPIAKFLEKHDFNVMVCNDAETALELFKKNENEISILFTDMVLPGMSGLALADQLKQFNDNLKVILTSGYTGGADGWLNKIQENYAFIQKPYDLSELLKKIDAIL